MRTVLIAACLIFVCLRYLPVPAVEGGKLVGETPTYNRDQGLQEQLFYVASGNGAGQVQYICEAQPGQRTSQAVWRIQLFTYDSSNRVSAITWANGDDAYNQVCDNRATLTYS